MTNKQEQGRSMVEMLGVLAVVGVLSAGGIAGYTYAMDRHHANEIINGVSMMAITASQQLLIKGDFSLGEFGEDLAGYAYVFDTDHSKQEDDFSVTVQGVSEGVCRQIMSMEWNLPHEIEVNDVTGGDCGDENNIAFVFTDDLGGYWEEKTTGYCGNFSCINCAMDETPLCTSGSSSYNIHTCICVPKGETGACGSYRCISCLAGEKPVCGTYGCICVPEGETGACSSDVCITCPAGETAKCSSSGSGEDACICVPEGETGACSPKKCITCPVGQTAKCSSFSSGEDSCICVPEGKEWACGGACITCPTGETPKCSAGFREDACVCVKDGETSACSSDVCITCPAGETPKCSKYGEYENACICVAEGEKAICSDHACVSCPEGQVGVCKEFGCACYNEGRCESGELMANDATCYPCNTESAIATTENECGLCGGTDSPRVYYNGSCYPDCRTSETPIMNSSGTCVACDSTTAIATDEGNCSACDGTDTPRVMENGKCVLKNCPTGDGETYVKMETGACAKCSAATIRSSDTSHLETCRAAGYPRFTNSAGTISYLCSRAGKLLSDAGSCHLCNDGGSASPRFLGNDGYCYTCSQTGSVATTAGECAQCGGLRTYDASSGKCTPTS